MSLSAPSGPGGLAAAAGVRTPGTGFAASSEAAGVPSSAPGISVVSVAWPPAARFSGAAFDLRSQRQRVARVDPVGVEDVLVLLPDLRPEVGVAVGALGDPPQGVAAHDRVGLHALLRRRRGPRRPVIARPVQRLGGTVGGQSGGRDQRERYEDGTHMPHDHGRPPEPGGKHTYSEITMAQNTRDVPSMSRFRGRDLKLFLTVWDRSEPAGPPSGYGSFARRSSASAAAAVLGKRRTTSR